MFEQEETKLLKMADHIKTDETVMVGTEECTNQLQVEFLCKHGRTMVMMYQASGDDKYLKQARLDLKRAKSIKAGFMRPLGAILNNAA